MFVLTITLYTLIGISHSIVLRGEPYYQTLGEYQKAGQQVANWLTQDFIKVSYICEVHNAN